MSIFKHDCGFTCSLTATGYICYLRSLHRLVADTNRMPWRDAILRLSPNMLAFVVLVSFVGTILLKAYVIGIVWRCYKYLTLRQHNAALMLPYVIPDVSLSGGGGGGRMRGSGGDVLGAASASRLERDYSTLLPGYEEALAQSMKHQPPPSYQAAMSTTTTTAPPAAAATTPETMTTAQPLVAATANATATGITVVLPPAPAAQAQIAAAERRD